MAEEAKSRGRGCLFWGCLTVVVIAVLGIGTIAGVAYYLKKQVDKALADTPVTIPVYEATVEESAIAKDKLTRLRTALKEGKAETLAFTAADLNTMVATEADLAVLRERVAFSIEGDVLKVNGSIPMGLILPFLQGKYLNGDISLKIVDENGQIKMYISEVLVKGEPISEEIMKQLRQTELMSELRNNQDPNLQQELAKFDQKVQSIEVRDGKLVIRTRGQDASPAPEAAPPANGNGAVE